MSAKKFKGDLTTLNLVGVFRNLGLECRESTPGKFHVECPWAHEHSKTGKTDTVIWQEGGKWPTFNCSHAHCDGRNIETVIEWAESMQRGIIDAHCSQGFRPGYKRQNDYSKSTRQAKAERPIVQPFRASGQRA